MSQRVLWARGYREPVKAAAFLKPQLEALHSPFALRDMDRAVDRLCRAIRDGERILLYGDYDVDGTTSVVILKTTLKLAGADVEHHVPDRLRDGYGMRPEVIEEAGRRGVTLVVSVDTGIRASEVVRHAAETGIDVIVTDHHLPEAELPPAAAVINPNRPDCTYPEKNLCGAAVALKLAQALMCGLKWEDRRCRALLESYLKLVAIATVADVVPLTGENRILVTHGLRGLADVRNAGLRALLRVAGFKSGECPSAGQVAFRLAPRLNAAGRMAHARQVIDLFFTIDSAEADRIADALHTLNKDRQETEATIVRLVEEECAATPVSESDAALVFSGKNWHKGVVGIVASRIVERYGRPVFILNEDEETGAATGSGRSIPAFHLLEALESMPDLFTKFGGHRQACGVTLPIAAVPEFRARFNQYAQRVLTPDDFRSLLSIDAVLRLEELTEAAVSDVCRLAPFGFGNPSPIFAVMDAEIMGANVRNERNVNVGLRQNTGRMIILTAWDWASQIDRLRPGTRVNAAVCLDDRGRDGQWKAVLKDVQPAETAVAAGQSPYSL
ncbi:MAG TPA: single-stranded-DNA-specific exonuclease RecJ [Bryobacteraceae bacterium]|nr:single-stranded-DNA-specific exonuclease RecJ [Bryobacteraceae bacterium]